MNQIIQPKCPYFQGEFVLPSSICPTAEVIFEKWGMNLADEQHPFDRLTHTAYNYVQSFFALIGLRNLFPLHTSLYADDVPRLIRLVVLDKEDVHSGGKLGQTFVESPLYFPTFFDKLGVLTALTQDLGVDVNYQRVGHANGDSALHFAARHGKVAAINVLLLAGADPYQENVWGETPHIIALNSDQKEAFQFLQSTAPMPTSNTDMERLTILSQKVNDMIQSIKKIMRSLNARTESM